jgi:hypothetical protein
MSEIVIGKNLVTEHALPCGFRCSYIGLPLIFALCFHLTLHSRKV